MRLIGPGPRETARSQYPLALIVMLIATAAAGGAVTGSSPCASRLTSLAVAASASATCKLASIANWETSWAWYGSRRARRVSRRRWICEWRVGRGAR